MFPLLGLVSSVLFVISVPAFGQTPVTQSSEQEVVEEVDWEELEPEVPSLSQEEFDAQFSNWENLGKTSLQQYLDSFDLFLETSLPVGYTLTNNKFYGIFENKNLSAAQLVPVWSDGRSRLLQESGNAVSGFPGS